MFRWRVKDGWQLYCRSCSHVASLSYLTCVTVCKCIGSAHYCIWKIKVYCSTELWPGPWGVGRRPRKDKKLGSTNKCMTFRMKQRGSELRVQKLKSHPCAKDVDRRPRVSLPVCLCTDSLFQCILNGHPESSLLLYQICLRAVSGEIEAWHHGIVFFFLGCRNKRKRRISCVLSQAVRGSRHISIRGDSHQGS